MVPPSYTDPFGSHLPALERSVLKQRAMQMMLVLFYTEELKRLAVGMIRGSDGFGQTPRLPPGVKNEVDKAFACLVADKAITAGEKAEIVALIDQRNFIGHQLHRLVADVNPQRYARQVVYLDPNLRGFDGNAPQRLRHFIRKLHGLYRTHHYVFPIDGRGMLFSAAEKTYQDEIKRLDRTIDRLTQRRVDQIKALSGELTLKGLDLTETSSPRHPLSQYDNKRLTKRGEEICFRLFDAGKSPMAIAHLCDISLVSARKRHRQWLTLGGTSRLRAELDALPRRTFYRRHRD